MGHYIIHGCAMNPLKTLFALLGLAWIVQLCFAVFPYPSPFVKLLVFPAISGSSEVEFEKIVFERLQKRIDRKPDVPVQKILEDLGTVCITRIHTSCGYRQPVLPLIERVLIVGIKNPPERGIRVVNYAYAGL